MFFNPISAIAGFDSRFKVYCDTTVSIPTNVATKIPLNQKLYDNNAEFNITLNRFVCKTAGEYTFKGQVLLPDMADSHRMQSTLYLNGTTRGLTSLVPIYSATPWTAVLQVVLEEQLSVNDYIELFTYQSGSARNIGIEIHQTWLSGHRIG